MIGLAVCCFVVSVALGRKLFYKNGTVMGPTPTQETAAKIFENFALFGKGGLVIALIVLALLNGYGDYVSKNPKKFMQDALLTGGAGALAAVFLTLTRGRPDLMINHFVFALMLFFLYHVCREFAGYFTVLGSEEKTSQIEKEQKILMKPLLITGGVILLMALVLSAIVHQSPDFSQGIFKSLGENTAFAIETLVFVGIVTGAEVFVAKNHGDDVLTAVGSSALLFTLAHLVLQGGGFYGHLYPMKPPNIE